MLSAIVTITKGTYLHLFTGTADPCKPLDSLEKTGTANVRSIRSGAIGIVGSVRHLLSS